MIEGNNYCPDNPADVHAAFLCLDCLGEFDIPDEDIFDAPCCPYCYYTDFVRITNPENTDQYSKDYDD